MLGCIFWGRLLTLPVGPGGKLLMTKDSRFAFSARPLPGGEGEPGAELAAPPQAAARREASAGRPPARWPRSSSPRPAAGRQPDRPDVSCPPGPFLHNPEAQYLTFSKEDSPASSSEPGRNGSAGSGLSVSGPSGSDSAGAQAAGGTPVRAGQAVGGAGGGEPSGSQPDGEDSGGPAPAANSSASPGPAGRVSAGPGTGGPGTGGPDADGADPDGADPDGAQAAGAQPASAQRSLSPAAAAKPSQSQTGSPGAEAVPSWATVLITTFRLWLQRRFTGRGPKQPSAGTAEGAGRRRRGLAAAAVVLACLVVALAVILATGVLTSSGRQEAAGQAGSGASSVNSGNSGQGAVSAVAASRGQTAGWIAAQVSRAAIVACDPVMCSAIQKDGFPAGNLQPVGPASNDPLPSSVVVATAAVRGQFGSRLSQVYAPLVMASFGSGAARIDIRATAVGSASLYLGELRSDLASRRQIGSQLLRNSRLAVTSSARQQLASGQVDSRLLMTLAALTSARHVQVLSFSDSGPGAAAGVPLRMARFGVLGTGGGGRAYLQWLQAFLTQQRAQFKAASVRVLRVAGRTAVDVEFSAPSPPGLLNSP